MVPALQLVELHRPSGFRMRLLVLAVKVRDRPRDLPRSPIAPNDVNPNRRQELLLRTSPVVEAAVVQRPLDVVPEDLAQERRPDDVLGALHDGGMSYTAQGLRVHLERRWPQSRVDGPESFVERQARCKRGRIWDRIGKCEGGIEGRHLGTEQDDLFFGRKGLIWTDALEPGWGGGSGSSATEIWGCMCGSAPSTSLRGWRTIAHRRL